MQRGRACRMAALNPFDHGGTHALRTTCASVFCATHALRLARRTLPAQSQNTTSVHVLGRQRPCNLLSVFLARLWVQVRSGRDVSCDRFT